MVLNNEFHSVFIENVINCNQSIRWVGITDHNGTIINERLREGLKRLLTEEENNQFAINSIIRHKARLKFESKMGKLMYAFRRYEKMSRCLIPINESYYLFLTMDFEEGNFDEMIIEKIIPFIQKEKRNL
jgi:hypothetical protein